MYPFIEIFGIKIYAFGLSITICFLLFMWMLKKLSKKFDFDYVIFIKNVFWIFLFVLFFSRLFYVISRWHDLKYIENPVEFFLMSDYNFSLMGAIFGFFVVFFILLRIRKEKLNTFISGIILSFLFILPIGYIGSLLGGQVYGIETNYGVEISYTHPFSPVPYQVPIFPLPIVYTIIFFILFSITYMLSQNEKYRTIYAYLGFMAFACIIFVLEFYSGKYGIFKDTIGINLSQICSIGIFCFCVYRLGKIYNQKSS